MPAPPTPGSKDAIPLDLLQATANLADDDFDFKLEEPEASAAGAPDGARDPAPNKNTVYAGPAPDLPPGLLSAVSRKTAVKKTAPLLFKQPAAGDVHPGIARIVSAKAGLPAALSRLGGVWLYVLLAAAIGLCTAGYYTVYPLLAMPSYDVARPAVSARPGTAGGSVAPPGDAGQFPEAPGAPDESAAIHAGAGAAAALPAPVAAAARPAGEGLMENPEAAAGASLPAGPPRPAAAGSSDESSQQAPADYYLYAAYAREQSGQPGQALSLYKKAAAVRPDDFKLLNKIGALLISLEQHHEAGRYLEAALGVKPDYGAALINRGIVAARTGQMEAAERYLSEALALDGTSRAALAAMMQLCRMRGDAGRAAGYRARLQALGFGVAE